MKKQKKCASKADAATGDLCTSNCGHAYSGAHSHAQAHSAAAPASHSHSHTHSHSHYSPHSHASSNPAAAASALPFRIAVSRSMGRSLVATQRIAAGDLIVKEWPAVLMQSRHNRMHVHACALCGRFVGNLQGQLIKLMRVAKEQQHNSPLPVLSASDCELSPIVPCVKGGCDVVYCSTGHRDLHSQQGHRLLCVAKEFCAPTQPTSKSKRAKTSTASSSADAENLSPVLAFFQHAEQQHEFFIAVGYIAARIFCDIDSGNSEADALKRFEQYAQKPWWDVVAPAEVMSMPQSNPASAPSASSSSSSGRKRRRSAEDASNSSDENDNESVRRHLRAVVSRSFSLLSRVLLSSRSSSCPAFFTLDWYSRMVGVMRLNALAVEHPNPLRDYAQVVDQTLQRLEQESLQQEDTDDAVEEIERDTSSSEEDDSSDSSDSDRESSARGGTAAAASSSSSAALSASPADKRRRILLHLQPLLARAMRIRLEDRMQRAEARVRARVDSKTEDDSSSDHTRVRKVDRDSFPTERYSWKLQHSRSHSVTLQFSTRLFPSMHGSALYPTLSCANHSCLPNASVEHGQDAEGRLHATRTIEAGEQIFISYIDEEAPKIERRAALADHSFVCQCEKCCEEASEEEADEE